jgi:hypothetical protein
MSVSSFPPALRASRSPHLPIYLGAWFSYIQDLPRGGRLSPWTTTHLYESQSGLAWPPVVSFAWGTLSIARRGSGRPCNVCGSTIAKESNELQVDQSAGSYAFVHEDCYRLWREESRR